MTSSMCWARAANISSNSAMALMPVSRLQDGHVGKRWRSTADPGYFTLDLAADVSLDTLGLFGLTLASTGSIRVRVSTAAGGATSGNVHDVTYTVADEEMDLDYGAFVLPFASPVSARYVRFDLADGAASYVEAGAVLAGLREAFTYNFVPGAGVTWNDRSRKSKTSGGQTLVFPDNKFRVVDFNLEWVTAAQRYGLHETIGRVNGTSAPVLLILDTDSDNLARDSIFGLIDAPAAALYTNLVGIFAKAYRIEERG